MAKPEFAVHLQSDKCMTLNLRTKTPEEREQALDAFGDEDTSSWDTHSAVDLDSSRREFQPGRMSPGTDIALFV